MICILIVKTSLRNDYDYKLLQNEWVKPGLASFLDKLYVKWIVYKCFWVQVNVNVAMLHTAVCVGKLDL